MELVTPCAAPAAVAGAQSSPILRDWIAIIEPNFSGHRWRYTEWIAEACIEAGERCLVVTDHEFASHPLSQRIASNPGPNLRLVPIDLHSHALAPLRNRSAYARFHGLFTRGFEALRREWPIRLVVVPYADYFFYTLGPFGSPFGSTDWIGLVMGITFHHAQVGVRTPRRPFVDLAKHWLFARGMNVHGLRTLLTIDPTLPAWFAASRAARRAAPLAYVADPFPETPAEDPLRARERLGLACGTRYLLVYGAISRRKGVRELVEALAYRTDAPTLLIAGEQDPETHAFLTGHSPRLAHAPVVLDRFIPDDLERALFSACDAVWLGYRQHYGMSGVLVQAYRFGKPVIATADGLIGWFCRDGQLGPLLEDLTPASITQAIDALAQQWRDERNECSERSERSDGAVKARTESLLARNTLDQFKRSFRQAVVATRT